MQNLIPRETSCLLYKEEALNRIKKQKAIDAGILLTTCEDCHTQLNNFDDHYKMGAEVKFLSLVVFIIPTNRNLTLSVKSHPGVDSAMLITSSEFYLTS